MVIVRTRQLHIATADKDADNIGMIVQAKLLKWARQRKEFQTQQVARAFRVSRQTASFHLKRLVEMGVLSKSGSTRAAVYAVSSGPQKPTATELRLIKKTKDLQASMVLEELRRRFPFKSAISQNVQEIFEFAFQEMLENVLTHSQSTHCRIVLKIEKGIFSFSLEDMGVGVFAQAMKTWNLEDEFSAAFHLFRNRAKIFSAQSPGRWIYFVSQMADHFVLLSHKVAVKVDNEKKDFLILENRFRKGTKLEFSIKARSKKALQQFYQDYAEESREVRELEARIQLVGSELLSRLQARRFISGLGNVRRIIFDFQKVEGIGQAFAEEIFKVFQQEHPEIILETVNANLAIQFMIARVL